MTKEQIIILIIAIVFITFLIIALIKIFRCPFTFPYKRIDFNVTGKRQPNINDYIDQFLIDGGMDEINAANDYFQHWQAACQKIIQNSKLKKLRTRQYLRIFDIDGMYIFSFFRVQTRYHQQYYVRTGYQVTNIVDTYKVSYEYIQDRYYALQKINFECTLSDYNKKEQRKLMTKDLRDKIAARDNYTCKQCGKYMPDGVGLHIDHIVPISKGGKSVPSNLQVLCSKCNGSKSART